MDDVISIPALREEGDDDRKQATNQRPQFLSPPSARRATDYYLSRGLAKIISIPALREEGDGRGRGDGDVPAISIPALREEGD